MNTPIKQQIDQRLQQLSEQRMAEVLDFVEFLAMKEQTTQAKPTPALGRIESAIERLSCIVKAGPKGRLKALQLDLTGFKFDREEANAR